MAVPRAATTRERNAAAKRRAAQRVSDMARQYIDRTVQCEECRTSRMVEGGDRLHHGALLGLGQFRIDRNRERRGGHGLRNREIPFPIAQPREALLQME